MLNLGPNNNISLDFTAETCGQSETANHKTNDATKAKNAEEDPKCKSIHETLPGQYLPNKLNKLTQSASQSVTSAIPHPTLGHFGRYTVLHQVDFPLVKARAAPNSDQVCTYFLNFLQNAKGDDHLRSKYSD